MFFGRGVSLTAGQPKPGPSEPHCQQKQLEDEQREDRSCSALLYQERVCTNMLKFFGGAAFVALLWTFGGA